MTEEFIKKLKKRFPGATFGPIQWERKIPEFPHYEIENPIPDLEEVSVRWIQEDGRAIALATYEKDHPDYIVLMDISVHGIDITGIGSLEDAVCNVEYPRPGVYMVYLTRGDSLFNPWFVEKLYFTNFASEGYELVFEGGYK